MNFSTRVHGVEKTNGRVRTIFRYIENTFNEGEEVVQYHILEDELSDTQNIGYYQYQYQYRVGQSSIPSLLLTFLLRNVVLYFSCYLEYMDQVHSTWYGLQNL